MNGQANEALEHIVSCCDQIGAFAGTGAPLHFIHQVALELAAAPSTPIFPDRYREHVDFALEQVATYLFTSPPAAIAAEYLLMRFEFYFRQLSGKLTGDGKGVSQADANVAFGTLLEPKLRRRRLSDVALAYQVMKLNVAHPAVEACAHIDRQLYPSPWETTRGTIRDVGVRIALARHSCGHGLAGDMSSEAIFYGLLTAVVFYNQR